MSGLIYRDIITQIRRSFLGNIIPDILFFFMYTRSRVNTVSVR